MGWERDRDMVRDDGSDVSVNFVIHSCGEPGNSWDDPGSGPEVEVLPDGRDTSGRLVNFTEGELERFEKELCEDPDLCDFLDEQPGDY